MKLKNVILFTAILGIVAIAAVSILGIPSANAVTSMAILAHVGAIEMNELNKAFDAAMTTLNSRIIEVRQNVLELEQKMAKRPVSGSFGASADGIFDAIEKSDQFSALMKGATKSVQISIPSAGLFKNSVITSDISGGKIGQADRASSITAPGTQRLRMRDLLPVVPTNAGSTEFVRELAYTNNAGPQYSNESPGPVTEGAEKNASEMTFELVTSPVVTIAHHFTVSRQALNDSAALRNHLETRGVYGLQLEEENEVLTGSGASGELSGLVGAAAAFTGGATNQTRLDTLRKAITQVILANHFPSGIVLHPGDAENIELAKDGESRYMGVVIYVSGQPYVWRLPIIESNSMTAGQFLVGDFAMAATIRDREVATVEFSLDHKDYRTRNLMLVLIEERIGLEIHRPSAMVTGSLTYAG